MVEEILTADAGTETTWNAGVAEEHKSAISGFTDTAGLAKGYSELFTKMGSSTKIPTADSPVEEVSAFYKQLGRPDTADGYTKPTLGEGEELDTEFFGKMATIAHSKGCSDALFAELSNGFIEHATHLKAQQDEAEVVEFNRYREESDRKLHEDLGADYDRDIELSSRAYTEYANDDLKALLETDRWKALRNEPSFILMMRDMGKKNMDDTFVKGDGQPEGKKDDYIPASPKSPTQYATMEGEEGKKARDWFRRTMSYDYGRAD